MMRLTTIGVWQIRYVPAGELLWHGRERAWTRMADHGHGRTEATVEIYDGRYTGEGFAPIGQFVSAYYVRTIIGGGTGPLSLQGDVPAWTMSADERAELVRWLRQVVR